LEQALGPRLGGLAGQLHRGEDVEEHSGREEARDLFGRKVGDPLDVGDEVAVALAYGLADVRIVAGRVRLHLGPEPGAVGQIPLYVSVSDRHARLLAPLALRGALEHLQRLAEAAGDDGAEELLLRAEEPEHVGLRDAGPARDVLRRGAVVAAVRELL